MSVDIRLFRRIDQLFEYRGDPLVIMCLADRPLRYTELLRVIPERSGIELSDTQLGRSLARLVRRGQVDRVEHDGVPLYKLTARGTIDAATLATILAAVDPQGS